jgi:phage-related protein (TIGR01555 family)
MFNRLWNRFKKPVIAELPKPEKPRQIFSTDELGYHATIERLEKLKDFLFKDAIHPELQVTMDAAKKIPNMSFAMDTQSIKSSFYGSDIVPNNLLLWYANQTFIGWQLCAMMAQNWLISKCCLMPAEDSTRKGYDITVNDGTEVEPEVLDYMRELDVKYNLTHNLIQFVQFGRVFGIRIAMFKVDSTDDEYYFKPFNIDGITEGSYQGISQIDPYWISPQLDPQAAGDPSSIHFYEPTWWNIAGKLVHRSHLVIYRTEELADILKPTYIYGGIPIPQKIYERVYAAERTANEAPMLALTKRSDVIHVDLAQAVANEEGFTKRIQQWAFFRDNYGIKALDIDEKMEQFDTSLADLDAVIMTQYQLVAAAANVPATKLLGTQPKGFNATGEHEEASYHEMLESIQCHALIPLLERHHQILIRSEIVKKFGITPFKTTVTFKPLDAMTAKEQAEVNKMKAETGNWLTQVGAIDGQDERQRVINDPDSGYTGLEEEMPNNTELFEPEEKGEL